MKGQWIGKYLRDNSISGTLVVNLDERKTNYTGAAYAYDDQPSLPCTYVNISTQNKRSNIHIDHCQLIPIHPQTGDPTPWIQLRSLYPPSVIFADCADIDINLSNGKLNVQWKTNIGQNNSVELKQLQDEDESEYKPIEHVCDWKSFKDFINKMFSDDSNNRKYIFRGQNNQKRLRTGFHRTRRADLRRFQIEDIKMLHRQLSQRTGHIFDLEKPEEYGAFLNLVQHHGYPTPLLDWTFSPFVGAFFAYHKTPKYDALKSKTKVRIFIFDKEAWENNFIKYIKLEAGRLHISMLEFLAIDNQRLIPQQSISMSTNVDDIETFIHSFENEKNKYLQVIDLPISERNTVMNELTQMGITAGSLFPGIEGTCEALKEQNF